MKFIENYKDRQWAALALTPEERDELKARLETGSDDIEIEDMFDHDGYKIERIRIVSDWRKFEHELKEKDTNVRWTTSTLWLLLITLVLFALIGIYSVFVYLF